MTFKPESAVVLVFFALLSMPVVAGIYHTEAVRNTSASEVQDRIYATTCGRYKDMTTWDRWTTSTGWKMGWCGKYLDRM